MCKGGQGYGWREYFRRDREHWSIDSLIIHATGHNKTTYQVWQVVVFLGGGVDQWGADRPGMKKVLLGESEVIHFW